MGWMVQKYDGQWQVVDTDNGALVATLSWDPKRNEWRCDCRCLHLVTLATLAGLAPPPPLPAGQVAPGTLFDPLMQKGY